jgi:hypothetical protein
MSVEVDQRMVRRVVRKRVRVRTRRRKKKVRRKANREANPSPRNPAVRSALCLRQTRAHQTWMQNGSLSVPWATGNKTFFGRFTDFLSSE